MSLHPGAYELAPNGLAFALTRITTTPVPVPGVIDSREGDALPCFSAAASDSEEEATREGKECNMEKPGSSRQQNHRSGPPLAHPSSIVPDTRLEDIARRAGAVPLDARWSLWNSLSRTQQRRLLERRRKQPARSQVEQKKRERKRLRGESQ